MAAVRPDSEPRLVAGDADLCVLIGLPRASEEEAPPEPPCLAVVDAGELQALKWRLSVQVLSDLPPLGLFIDTIESPRRLLRRVAFIAESERDGLSSTIAAALRDRFELGLFATQAASAQALESVSGCPVRVVSPETQDELLRPFDMIVSFSRGQIIRATARLKPTVWLREVDEDAAIGLAPTVYRGLPIELPAVLAQHEPDHVLPALFNWKRAAEADARAKIDAALAAVGL
ncbi:MAG: hypothetical protein FJX60_18585 [Alphaproteobacteria bacterium]|nr:hypothetical protein [Alphaproteobacteria bacterium]